MASRPYLSVVIPAYNEAENFKAGVLDSVIEFLAKQKFVWEVILVNDGSIDTTQKLLSEFCNKQPNFKLLNITHGGKAAAVTAGVNAAQGEIILFTDFDQSTPIKQLGKFLQAHKSGADVVIGSRTMTQEDTLVRKIRSWLFVTLVQIVALPGITDSQCGFKSFTDQAAKKIFANFKVSNSGGKVTGGYMGAFDVEILFVARKFGYKIVQIPVEWTKFVSNRLNIWKEPLMMARDTFKVRLYDLQGQYDHD